MAVRPVKKVTMVALKQAREDILSQIQRFGMLEITDLTAEPQDLPEGLTSPDPEEDGILSGYRDDLERIEQAIGFIGQFDDTKQSFLAVPASATVEEMVQTVDREREPVMADVGAALALREQIGDLRSAILRIDSRLQQLEPWRELPIPVEDLKDTRDAVVAAGTMPTAEWYTFIDDMREMNTLNLEEISGDRESIRLLALCHKLESGTLSRALTRAGFVRAEFSGEEGLPADIIAGYRETREQHEGRIGDIEKQAASMTRSLKSMKRLYDGLTLLRDRREAMLRFGDTRSAFYLSGWIPADHCREFEKRMKAVTEAVEIDFREPRSDEFAPTLIENNRVIEPFESITEMYSTPQRNEFDPNALMAPFFFAFFGMMVSDAGYGLLIAAVASVLYYLMRRKGNNAKLVMVVALGGLSTFLWGSLFGGWFGFSLKPLWFNPLEDPLTMLVLCFGLGLLQIMVGIILKMLAEFRARHIARGIFENLCWVLTFVGVLMLAAPMLGDSPALSTLGVVGKWMALVSIAGIILGKAGISFADKWRENPEKHSFGSALGYAFGGLMGGIMALYSVTGYFSDILSYSRLFALGLATGVVGMVINTIIGMLTGGTGIIGVLGWIIGSLIFVGGHIFNIVINALGAYVHASRLQYIEYFGKFMEGGGRPFKPFRLKTRYHLLKTEQ